VGLPRISVFASSADGNVSPVRVIEGQKTLQARTSHEIAVDTIHDEFAVPNPFAESFLFFRGGTNGNEDPIRIIQGPKTLLRYPDNLALDATHRELFTAQVLTDSVLAFRSDVGGDQGPVRILRGPKTKLDLPIHVGVDPVNNLLAVNTNNGILIFNRTDNGDVAPRWILNSGAKTGLGLRAHTRTVLLYPEGKKIITGGAFRVGGSNHTFIGIWKYGDNGDVAPWAVLNSTPLTKMRNAGHLGINPKDKELLVAGDGKLLIYRIPEIFEPTD
jgi:hypothetical protein